LKTCTLCKVKFLATTEFFHKDCQKQDGLSSRCKICLNKNKRKYWEENKERINSLRRTYEYKKTKINREKRAEANKKYNSKEKAKIKAKERRIKTRLRRNELAVVYNKILKNRLRKVIRGRLKKILNNTTTNYKTKVLVLINNAIEYDFTDLKSRLECQFRPGMSWDNYGVFGWHIDHKKPLSSFNLEDPKQLKIACMLSNLQPLWANENLQKSNKSIYL
jgi:hypothetical protein